MAADDRTKLLGLRGLFIEAQRRDDLASASAYAEEAAKIAPSLPWAGQAALQIRCASGDWAGALEMLEKNRTAARLIVRIIAGSARYFSPHARLRCRIASARPRSRWFTRAVKLAPDLVPAVALAARYLAEAGDLRKATRVIERTWEVTPHPDLGRDLCLSALR